jgi:hypothetical protein
MQSRRQFFRLLVGAAAVKVAAQTLFVQVGRVAGRFTSHFRWNPHSPIDDWRYVMQIANIDTTTAGLAGPTPPDIFATLESCLTHD